MMSLRLNGFGAGTLRKLHQRCDSPWKPLAPKLEARMTLSIELRPLSIIKEEIASSLNIANHACLWHLICPEKQPPMLQPERISLPQSRADTTVAALYFSRSHSKLAIRRIGIPHLLRPGAFSCRLIQTIAA